MVRINHQRVGDKGSRQRPRQTGVNRQKQKTWYLYKPSVEAKYVFWKSGKSQYQGLIQDFLNGLGSTKRT